MTVAVVTEGTRTGGGAKAGFRQAFLERVGLTVMDSNRCLRYLSRNPALKLEIISSSSSSSSSQIIRGTTPSTPASGLSLEDEEDRDDKEDKVDEEDGDVGGEVLTLRTG